MKVYEYIDKFFKIDKPGDMPMAELNAMGADGWHLAVTPTMGVYYQDQGLGWVCLFEREVEVEKTSVEVSFAPSSGVKSPTPAVPREPKPEPVEVKPLEVFAKAEEPSHGKGKGKGGKRK